MSRFVSSGSEVESVVSRPTLEESAAAVGPEQFATSESRTHEWQRTLGETVDRIDRKLLVALQRNARLSFAALSREVGLSENATRLRVRRLENEGYIQGYQAVVSAELLDLKALHFALVTLEEHTETSEEIFYDNVNQIDFVLECYKVSGTADYLMKFRSLSNQEYNTKLRYLTSRIKGIKNITSLTVLDEIRHESTLPVELD